MAAVYVNAYFTLVIAAWDVEDVGLPGLGCHRQAPPYTTFNFTSTCCMYEVNPSLTRTTPTPWYFQRGWTFQEYILSRRQLIFHDNTVSWTCQLSNHTESGHHGGHPKSSNALPTSIDRQIWTSWPNISSYLENVQQYSLRTLTRSDDVLNAFRAFTVVQGRAMEGGILMASQNCSLVQLCCGLRRTCWRGA